MNFWEFLDNLIESILIAIVIILCTPLGWIGLIILGALIETWKG